MYSTVHQSYAFEFFIFRQFKDSFNHLEAENLIPISTRLSYHRLPSLRDCLIQLSCILFCSLVAEMPYWFVCYNIRLGHISKNLCMGILEGPIQGKTIYFVGIFCIYGNTMKLLLL